MNKIKGDIGGITVTCVPNSTLETALDALTNRYFSSYYDVNVKFTFANQDFEVAICGANEQPDGVIKSINKVSGSYDIAVYTTKFNGFQAINLTGLALGDYVEAGAAGIWAIDNTNGTYRVIANDDPEAIVVKAGMTGVTAIVSLTDSTGGTANNTVAALPTLTDSPATADALRDDIVTNLVPVLTANFADLAAKVNELVVAVNRLK